MMSIATPTFWINHASRLLVREFEQQLRPLDPLFSSERCAHGARE
jgi:hypothetical protein